MRVGIAITSLHGGGAELVARRWADGLASRGHDVIVYVYEPGGTTGRKAPEQLVSSAVTVRAFRARGRVGRLLGLPRWLRRQSADDGLDVLVSMLTYTNLAALAGWRLGPRPACALIVSERNAPTVYLPLRGAGGRAQVRAARLAYRAADAVIAVSHPVAGDLVGGYGIPAARCFVVPNPVLNRAPAGRPELTSIDGDSATDAPAKPAAAPLTVAFVGRLVPQKQPARFVDTLEELARRLGPHGVRGIVIGTGTLDQSTRVAAAAAGVSIEHVGWQEPWTAAALHAGADVLLLPSAVEGFGNVLVEAADAGLPSVAASTALGVADAIVPGLTGELALTDAPQDLADAVLRAVAPDHGGLPLGRWLDRFSVPASLDALERVLTLTRAAAAPPPD